MVHFEYKKIVYIIVKSDTSVIVSELNCVVLSVFV